MLCLNASKTENILFISQSWSNTTKQLNVRISSQRVERINEVKFLGLVINGFLEWKTHFTHLNKKLNRTIGLFSKIRHHTSQHFVKSIFIFSLILFIFSLILFMFSLILFMFSLILFVISLILFIFSLILFTFSLTLFIFSAILFILILILFVFTLILLTLSLILFMFSLVLFTFSLILFIFSLILLVFSFILFAFSLILFAFSLTLFIFSLYIFTLILLYAVYLFVFSLTNRAGVHRAENNQVKLIKHQRHDYKNTENRILNRNKSIVKKTESWKTLEELHSL